MKIAIIGTAGRNEDGYKLNKEKYREMVAVIAGIQDLQKSILVSGGAAWADHLAVIPFVLGKTAGLHLHLPCDWNYQLKQFVDTGSDDWRVNPGKTANWYHRRFAMSIAGDETYTLHQIDEAITKGAVVKTGNGFFDRNTAVAKESDALYAFTFGEGARIADGGTRDTFEKFKKFKPNATAMHFNLSEMRLYEVAE